MYENLLDTAPKELINDIALLDGTFYCTDVWRGEPVFLSYQSYLRRKGIARFEYISAEEFSRKYRAAQPGASEEMGDLQNYMIKLIREAAEKNATDIHLAYYGSYGFIKLRRLGLLRDYDRLPGERIKELIGVAYNKMTKSATSTTYQPRYRQDARIVGREFLPADVHSVRVHSEPLECAEAEGGTGSFMALRLLYDSTGARGGLDERLTALGYDGQDIAKFQSLMKRAGLIIISGPTGHGKSTLLKHLMDAQAEKFPEKNYMSIEDPPEYPLKGVHQLPVVTSDTTADPAKRAQEYINAIAGAMRSDPDVLMIGEIRYPEAAKAAIDAAMTGHGALATLHANSAMGIIARMESLLNEAGQKNPLQYLGDHSILAGLIYQRLTPVLCPQCKLSLKSLTSGQVSTEDAQHRDTVLPPDTADRLRTVVADLDAVHIRGRGCPACDHLGLAGQTVAAEVIVTDETFLRHVRQGNADKAYEYWLNDMRGRTYVQHAIDGIARGRLDPYLAELRLGVNLDFTRSAGEKCLLS